MLTSCHLTLEVLAIKFSENCIFPRFLSIAVQILKECLRTKSVLQEQDNFGIVKLLIYSTCGEFQSFFNQSKAFSIRSQILRVI